MLLLVGETVAVGVGVGGGDGLLKLVGRATLDEGEGICDGISELIASPELVGKLGVAPVEGDENCAADVGLLALRELLCSVG